MEVTQTLSAHRAPAEVAGQTGRERLSKISRDCTSAIAQTRILAQCYAPCGLGNSWFEEFAQLRGGSSGSACSPVIVPVFKTGGRQVSLSPVGSTPTRFRHTLCP